MSKHILNRAREPDKDTYVEHHGERQMRDNAKLP